MRKYMIVSITLHETCSGGGHARVNVSVDAGPSTRIEYQTDDLLAPLTNAERKDLVGWLLRAKLGGMTRAQARTAMLAGISVTL